MLLTTGMTLDTRQGPARLVERLAEPRLAALGFGDRLRPRGGAQGAVARPRRARASRCSRSPTTRRSSRSPRRRSRGWSTSSTRCCSARSPRTSASSGSCSPSAGLDGDRRRARGADRRRGARASTPAASCSRRRGFRRALDGRGGRGDRPRSCASGARTRRAAAASRPARPSWRPRAGAAGRRRRSPTRAAQAAAGVARGRQGRRRAVGVRPALLHQAVTVVALELLRRRVADDTERRLAGDVLSELVARRARGAELQPPPRALRPRRPRRRAGARAAGADAVQNGRARAAAPPLRDEARSAASRPSRRAGLRAGARRADDEELFALAERVPRAWLGGSGARCAGGVGRAVPAARPGGPSTRRAARWRRACSGRRGERTATRAPGRRSPPTATSAPSSCCCRCRTPTRCGCSATRCSARSKPARATTAAS